MAVSVKIQVLFFGVLKDEAGRASEELTVEEGTRVSDVVARYAAEVPRIAELDRAVVVARNQRFARRDELLMEGDELALMPPVSGGTSPWTQAIEDESGHFFALTREPIDIKALRDRLLRPEDGAIDVFEGVVRNNTKGRPTLRLEYECYEAMAIRTMAELGREIAARHEIGRFAMVHRLGRMEIGEASVVIVATAPHRRPAFEAALEGINRLKKTVPIWKKEFFADGEVWVEGEWDDSLTGR